MPRGQLWEKYGSVLSDLMSDKDPGIDVYVDAIIDENVYEAYYAVITTGYVPGMRKVAEVMLASPDYSDWGRAYFTFLKLHDYDKAEEAVRKTKEHFGVEFFQRN